MFLCYGDCVERFLAVPNVMLPWLSELTPQRMLFLASAVGQSNVLTVMMTSNNDI
jgi:hypothetical protein